MTSQTPRPPYDKELGEFLKTTMIPIALTNTHIELFRKMPETKVEDVFIQPYNSHGHTERTFDGPHVLIILSVFTPKGLEAQSSAPCIFWIHGGGMIFGNRYTSIHDLWEYGLEFNAVVVSVEYRLALENPDPAPVNDCYAGLEWVASHASELRIDGHQYDNEGSWSRTSNLTGWKSLLGDRCGGDDVSIYAAPGGAEDLSGLPQTFIDCGSAEVFRDEDVAFATRLWAAGIQAELHVWSGGFHGFDIIAPNAVLSQKAKEVRKDWIKKILVDGL